MSDLARAFARLDRQVALPLAVVFALGGPLRAAPQDEGAAAPAVQLDAEVLGAVERILTPPAGAAGVDPKQMAKALVELGAPALPVVVSMLAGEVEAPYFVPGTLEEPVHPKALAQRSEVLRAALAGFPRSAVLAHLEERLGADPSMDLRLMLAGVLGDVRDDRAFALLLSIVEGIDSIHLQRSYVQSTLEPALAAHLVREPALLGDLDKRAFRADAGVLGVYARAVGLTHSSRGIEMLAGWIGRDADLDAILLAQLGRVAGDGGLAVSPAALGIVRRNAGSADLQVQRAALVALGRLRDVESFDPLVELLESESSPKLAVSSARWSLVRICGEDLGGDAQAWRDWRERQRTWWNDQAPARLEALHADEPGVVLQAVSDLVRQRLQRDAVAEALGPLLAHTDEGIARGTCAAIARLDSSKAVPWLLDALTKPDPELRRIAAQGLARLTGLDLPPDPLVWSKLLAS